MEEELPVAIADSCAEQSSNRSADVRYLHVIPHATPLFRASLCPTLIARSTNPPNGPRAAQATLLTVASGRFPFFMEKWRLFLETPAVAVPHGSVTRAAMMLTHLLMPSRYADMMLELSGTRCRDGHRIHRSLSGIRRRKPRQK